MRKFLWPAIAALMFAFPASAYRAGRVTVPLTNGWRFSLGNSAEGAEAPDFDDAAWPIVSVPHSWNRVGYYLPHPETHLNRSDNVDKTQGIGWYRLALYPSADFRGKRAWLQFDAASRIATVWLNGILLGEHKGGFSRFRFDATNALRLGGRNLLTVKVDNSQPAPGSATADVLPLAGDFFVHGGLYRPASLIAMDPVHIDMLDHGGPGVYATTKTIGAPGATVAIMSRLRNDSGRMSSLQVIAQLVDAAGRVAAQERRAIRIAPHQGLELEQSLHLAHAHLWRGTDDPYLYRLTVRLVDTDGRLLDQLDQPYGIRQMRFDPTRGFLLNGKPYPLHGTGYHQDREGKGWAISADDVAGDVRILREMGANAIRLTHYQHGQTIHDLADRYGLIVWDEIPLVSMWTLGHASEASPGLRANARQQLIEEIRQDGNHASVATWGIANEVDFGASIPAFISTANGIPPDPFPLLRDLNALAHQLDPSRPTSLANCCEGDLLGPNSHVPVTAQVVDLNGANRYFGWYYGTRTGLGANLDSLRATRPDQPLAVTEYGAGGATSIHTDNVTGGPVDARGRAQPEEVESWIHEANWPDIAARPFLAASWLWTSFDFATTVRREGDAEDINTKGLVTYDRKVKKDAYYYYKANWTATPTVHINGRRYVDRAYAVTDVQVYSNAPATELIVRGTSMGVRANCPRNVCVWERVRLATGENDVVARGRFKRGPVEDRVTWRLDPAVARTIRIDSGALVAAKSDEGLYGSDNFFEGGEATMMGKASDFGRPAQPVHIAGTSDSAVAATYRHGDFGYHVPLNDGRYLVTLTFVEPSAGDGERLFDVSANGATVLSAIDVANAAGARLTAVRRSFAVEVRQGQLDLRFKPLKGEAIVSAIEIARQ